MLDNLKLGYGGTKTEMERLLADAEEISGIHYDISNLNDVYEAIHVVQTELNVTGTTAREAASTVAGSVSMMKASWQNLLIAIGKGEGVNTAVNEFLASLGTVAQNIIPRVITIAGSVVTGLVQAIPKIMSGLASAISKYADSISSKSAGNWLKAGGKLLKSLLTGILKAGPQLIAAVAKLALQILKSFSSINLRSAGRAIINSLLSGLRAAWNALKSWVSSKVSWIKETFSGAKSAGNAPSGGRGHRIGLREVPYDGYQAILHKGEMVLSAAEANQYEKDLNRGSVYNGGDITINVYGTNNMNVNDLAAAVERKLINTQNRRRLAWQ
jgi:phage-related protein